MAERLNKRHQNLVRQKIKTSVHLTNLHKCATGKLEMSDKALRSAIFLVEQSIGKAPQHVAAEVESDLTINVIDYGTGDDPE